MPKTNSDPAKLAGERTIKRFRVAREGRTIDGRTLSQQEIIDIAETYDPVEYTARINCEHISGWFDDIDGKFSALGDVVAVDSRLETFTINGQEVELMCLYATLSALPKLVQANKEGKKLFTSIEFYRKFASTGRAYMVGLAVTDNPASLGTEPLKFNRNDVNITEPQELMLMTTQDKDNYSHQHEAEHLTNSPAHDPATASTPSNEDTTKEDGFLTKLKTIFGKGGTGKGMSKEEQDQVLESFSEVRNKLDKLNNAYAELSTAHDQLQAEFEQLSKQLQGQDNFTKVGEVTGQGEELADF